MSPRCYRSSTIAESCGDLAGFRQVLFDLIAAHDHAVHRIGYVEHSGMELSQEEQSGNLLLVAEKPLN